MKNTLIILFLAISINIINAQIPIGHVNDMDGISFNGYFDAIDYSPNKGLSVSYYSTELNFNEAYYYDKAGVKMEGFIKLHHKRIFFKTTDLDKEIKVNASEIQSCVVGKDSFISILGNDNKYKLVKYLATYNDFTFIITNNKSSHPEIINYIKSKKDNQWLKIDTDSIFYIKVKPIFATIPAIKDKIDSYRLKDLPMLLKVAKYNKKYLEKKPIFFDKNWQELKDKHKKTRYTAKITTIRDSIWTFEYYNNAVKLYKANYSSFNPTIKNGNFVAYYPDGKIRRIVYYENDKPIRVKLYNNKGAQISQFKFVEIKKRKLSEKYIKYSIINDSLGYNILKSNDTYSDIVIDKYNRASYHRVFKNKQLVSKYRFNGKDTIFQIIDLNFKYKKLKKIQFRLNSYVFENEFSKSTIEDVQGIALLYFLIDTKGNVIKGKLLNSINSKTDTFLKNFIEDVYIKQYQEDEDEEDDEDDEDEDDDEEDESLYKSKFKPIAKGEKNRYWEFVLPVLFRVEEHDPSIWQNNFYQFNNYPHNFPITLPNNRTIIIPVR